MMTSFKEDICVVSYNSRGLGMEVVKYVNDIVIFADVLCVQEHFQLY